MEVVIKYEEVFEGCKKLTSFEGREAVSPTGESLYPELHLTEQDKDLLNDYAKQGAHEIEQVLTRYVSVSTIGTNGITLTIDPIDTRRISRGTIDSMVHETVCAFVMSQWLSNRLPQRVEFYNNLFAEMCKSILSGIATKRKPTLNDIEGE